MTKNTKLVLSLVAVAACAGAFGTYESYQQSGESDALLAENVEALSSSENKIGFFVFHTTYFNPTTNLATDKCTSFSYPGPGGTCVLSHDHGAIKCCTGC